MKNKSTYICTIIMILILGFVSPSSAQYFDNNQINNISNAQSASEGDFYLDTINNDFFIGLSSGKLARIGDTLDELIDSINFINDTLFVYQNDTTLRVSIQSSGTNIFNTDGTLTSTRLFDGGNLSLQFTNFDSITLSADSIYVTNLPQKNDTVLRFVGVSNNDKLNKFILSTEWFDPIPSNPIVLIHSSIQGRQMIKLYYNGQLLFRDRDYTATGNTINLLFDFDSSDIIQVDYYHN